jgi:catechol 2,3-dioxygenase-like lactoylglutathione lyase family enzyme
MNRRSLCVVAVLLCAALRVVSAQSSDLDGIAHVALRVNDVAQSREFYEKLGFEQAFQFDQDGKVTQAFLKINDRQFIELYPRTEESQTIGLMHVCYEASHIDAVREAYAKAGLNPTEVKKARAGNLLFVLHDPEGQIVEYTEYLPGSLHWEDRGKHLGEHRIAQQLHGVSIPVKDANAERDFYVGKLGFYRTGMSGQQVAVMLRGGEGSIALSQAGPAQLWFALLNPERTKKIIQDAGLTAKMMQHRVVVRDPDGNELVFELLAKPAGRAP